MIKRKNKFYVLFPRDLQGGHEEMAFTHFILSQSEDAKPLHFCRTNFASNRTYIWQLASNRFNFNTVLLINGSPYGHFGLKIVLKCFRFKIIEYTPFPELLEMRDRFYHPLIAHLNRFIVNERILIDDWQVPYSRVKNNSVLRNHV
jgi:hypothetical protein